jgi:hypothetical protein
MKEAKPGPGWEKGKDQRWHPDWLNYADFRGAQALSAVFKLLAMFVVVSGAFAAVEGSRVLQGSGLGGSKPVVVLGIAGVTVVAASALAFFGYVLELLVAVHYDVRFSDARQEVAAEESEQRAG